MASNFSRQEIQVVPHPPDSGSDRDRATTHNITQLSFSYPHQIDIQAGNPHPELALQATSKTSISRTVKPNFLSRKILPAIPVSFAYAVPNEPQ
jgi:hypothetical protein